MRCFPHCCPGHRARNYCGSSLHIKVHSSSLDAGRQLVVYCRFRPVDEDQLVLGDRVLVKSIQSSLQRADPSSGMWIDTCRSRSEAEPLLFQINPSNRWYYAWSSSATLTMRSVQHVLEAVVFERVSSTELLVVCVTLSPTFVISSFRRSITQSKKREPKDLSSSRPSSRTSAKRRPIVRTSRTDTVTSKTSPINQITRQPFLRDSPVSIASGYSTIGPTRSPLECVMTWLQVVPARNVGSQPILAWEKVVKDMYQAHMIASPQYGTLASTLDVPPARQEPALPPFPFIQSPLGHQLDVIDSAVRVLLHEWMSLDSTRASSHTFKKLLRVGQLPSRGELLEVYCQWIKESEDRAETTLSPYSTISWPQLQATLTAFEAQYLSSRSADTTAEFSYRWFVAKYREQLSMKHISTRNELRSLKRRRLASHGVTKNTDCQSSARVWMSGMEHISVEMNGVAQQSLSLLSVVQFWRHLSCVRFDYSGTQLSVASVFNSCPGGDRSFTKLTLDGQYRWFSSLPSGEPTTGTTLMGYVVGDYVGRTTSAGTIHFTTYLWPSKTSTGTPLGASGSGSGCASGCASGSVSAYAWHWTIDATSLSVGSSSTVVSVVVESAEVGRCPYAMETLSLSEKLQYVGRWLYACEARLAYQAVHPHESKRGP